MLMQPRQLDFTIPDAAQADSMHRLTCYEWGNPQSSQVILCVHGLTRNGRDFDFLAEALASGYRVLCPDMPGRGQSQWLSKPADYNNAAYVTDINYVLAALNIERLHWVGTSMGGIIALLMANARPGLISSLTLNDIGCFIPAAAVQRIKDIADMKTEYTTREEAEAAFRKRSATFGIHDEKHWQHLLQFALENHTGRVRFTYDPAIFVAGFDKNIPTTDIDLWPLWQAVTHIPVLLLRGGVSDILPHATAMEMQHRHPDLTLHELEGIGHAPALMEHKQIALIHGWISAK